MKKTKSEPKIAVRAVCAHCLKRHTFEYPESVLDLSSNKIEKAALIMDIEGWAHSIYDLDIGYAAYVSCPDCLINDLETHGRSGLPTAKGYREHGNFGIAFIALCTRCLTVKSVPGPNMEYDEHDEDEEMRFRNMLRAAGWAFTSVRHKGAIHPHTLCPDCIRTDMGKLRAAGVAHPLTLDNQEEIWLSAVEVSDLLCVSRQAVAKLCTKNKITFKVVNGNGGKQYRILLSSLPAQAQDKYRDQR